jgi:uncharacterized protein (TIGR04255 family)
VTTRSGSRSKGSATTTSSRPALPEYAKPPVVEVAISVQFEELAGFRPIHFGLYWERVKARYPTTQHQPPLGSIVELFGSRGAQRASMSIDTQFPLGRCWYLSPDQLRLVQVQPDRFVLNWRKLDTDTTYPRYDTLRKLFIDELHRFLDFAAEYALGEFVPLQCELTYVNHVIADRGRGAPQDLSNMITLWSGETSEAYLPEPEDVRLAWQYKFEESNAALGRLHVHLQPALRTADRTPLLMLQLLARGAPAGDGIEGVLAFADRAHEWIVRGFTAITTENMHRVWERQR